MANVDYEIRANGDDVMKVRDIRPLTKAETQWKVAQAIKRAVDNFVPNKVKPAIAGLTTVKEM